MRPFIAAAQAISLRGSGSGARAIQLPCAVALGAGLSKTFWMAASSGLSTRPGAFRRSYMPPCAGVRVLRGAGAARSSLAGR